MYVRALREEAQKYRRLADWIYDPTAAAELEDYARTLEERASCLEAARRSPERSDDVAC